MTASTSETPRPPAIVCGGHPQALSAGRSLAGLGVPVYGVGVAPQLRLSRAFTRVFSLGNKQGDGQARLDWLMGPEGALLAGAVLLTTDDVALEMAALHRDRLAERFVLDQFDPDAQLAFLNKRTTYEIATRAEVPTPRFWLVRGTEQLRARRSEFVYPLLVKPLLSHEYQAKFPGKFRRAFSFEQLLQHYAAMGEAGIEVMLVEMIPGPDTQLYSYFTYLDDDGEPTFDYCKQVIRRFPPSEGFATYHVTHDLVPNLRAQALRLFRAAGLRGVVNVEFKMDTRDRQLKLIEVNARLAGSNALVVNAGIDLAQLIYRRSLGEQVSWPTTYPRGLRLWTPGDDVRAMLAMRRAGEITVVEYLRSIAYRKRVPIMRWNDPGPALARAYGRIGRMLTGRVRKVEQR